MFTILNRFPRGMYSIGAKFNGVVLGLLAYYFFHNPYVSIAVAIGYVLGEAFCGYGDHVGNITENRWSIFSYFPDDGDTVGCRWITSFIVYPQLWKLHLSNAKIGIKNIYPRTMNLEIKGYSLAKLFKNKFIVMPIDTFVIDKAMTYSRVFMVIRGFYWWFPTLMPLYFVGISLDTLIIAISLLAIGFPIACEIGYYTTTKFNFKHMGSGWEHQEVWYGLMQDIVLVSLYLSFNF